MEYPILATIFFLSLFLILILVFGAIFRPTIWMKSKKKIKVFFALWFFPYLVFILFFTGPEGIDNDSVQTNSPYKLPWAAGISRFVAQGNNSFTSHRGTHRFAWDFVMANGTEVLAARAGRVVEVKDAWDGIGLNSNYISVEHEDSERSVYAHIRFRGGLVKVGDIVRQGQPIALSGMVGQTIFPHVHFYVTDKEGAKAIPISFAEVPGGIPLAGRFYTSENTIQ